MGPYFQSPSIWMGWVLRCRAAPPYQNDPLVIPRGNQWCPIPIRCGLFKKNNSFFWGSWKYERNEWNSSLIFTFCFYIVFVHYLWNLGWNLGNERRRNQSSIAFIYGVAYALRRVNEGRSWMYEPRRSKIGSSKKIVDECKYMIIPVYTSIFVLFRKHSWNTGLSMYHTVTANMGYRRFTALLEKMPFSHGKSHTNLFSWSNQLQNT